MGSTDVPEPPSPFRYVGVGFELVVPILVGLFLGRLLDRWWDTSPWLLLLGTALGMAAGFLGFFRSVLPPRAGKGSGGA